MKKLILLHMIFLLYSICGVFGKLAAKTEYLSIQFFGIYACSLIILVIYSFLWQRVLISIPLTTAYSSKGVTVIWGIVWGAMFFGEDINFAKVIAAFLIVSGIAVIGKVGD